jgi:ArsR family transcriptional regulator
MFRETAPIEACCTSLSVAPLSSEEADRMASALAVLADPVRLRIVSLLERANEACVCEMTPSLGVSQPTVSHHLKILADAGLVERDQRGRWAFYRLRRDPLVALAGSLAPTRPDLPDAEQIA